MKINIYTIAEEANTSISTVSRYLNGKNVKPDTRKRIEEVIDKYNYKPSLIAKALVSHSLKTIAVFVVDIRMPHYAYAAYYIDKELSKYGYRTIICNTSGELAPMFKYIADVSTQVDGMIFVGSIFNEINKSVEVLKSIHNIPVVSTNGKINVNRNRAIYVDDQKGIYNGTKYLVNKNCKQIAYIQYGNNQSALSKVEGYKKAMNEAMLTPLIYHTNDLFSGYDVTKRILFDCPYVEAIISGEDLISMGAIRALVNAGIKVGKDCLVIGFDDSKYCELTNPTLTAIDNKVYETAIASATSLRELIENPEAKTSDVILNCELNVKESA